MSKIADTLHSATNTIPATTSNKRLTACTLSGSCDHIPASISSQKFAAELIGFTGNALTMKDYHKNYSLLGYVHTYIRIISLMLSYNYYVPIPIPSYNKWDSIMVTLLTVLNKISCYSQYNLYIRNS